MAVACILSAGNAKRQLLDHLQRDHFASNFRKAFRALNLHKTIFIEAYNIARIVPAARSVSPLAFSADGTSSLRPVFHAQIAIHDIRPFQL